VTLIDALRSRDLKALRAAIAADAKGAGGARAVGEAGRLAWREAFELLFAAGGDLNALYRNYRPLHALLQEEAHAASGQPSAERLACLEWLLDHGADPEQTGGWPMARGIVVAGFVGRPEYVKILRKHAVKMDGFAGAALGDRKLVEKALAVTPGFARERDGGILTALHCAAGSRVPKADRRGIAELLLDAGAEINATARSWSHDVDAIYFASGTQDLALFDLLLERGADPTHGLGCAIWSAAYDLAASALAHGAQIDRATSNGKPLLNDLIRWGQFAQVYWLLDRGASCNVADAEGWTAVHQAASRGNERALRTVLDAGGDKTRRDKAGQVPRDLARSDKVAEMLKK
jgi:Ankyrin repeats (many copies)/Ankyrin repeat